MEFPLAGILGIWSFRVDAVRYDLCRDIRVSRLLSLNPEHLLLNYTASFTFTFPEIPREPRL